MVLTLTCVYLSLWSVTRSRGVRDVEQRFAFIGLPASSPAPLLVGINDEIQSGWYAQEVRTYYVWIFGYTMKLPFERNVGKPSKRNSRPVGDFVIPLPNAETRESRMFGSSSVDEGPE
jgi:hypothetical protein